MTFVVPVSLFWASNKLRKQIDGIQIYDNF